MEATPIGIGKKPTGSPNRQWKDLLPLREKFSGYTLNAIAKRWARDCEPEKALAPVFRVFFCGAILLCLLHLVFVVFSVAKIWGN